MNENIFNTLVFVMTCMAHSTVYRIADSDEKGMVAVATRDIMPGELTMEEKEPLLSFSLADVESCKCASPNAELALAGYKAFESMLNPVIRRKFLSLRVPAADNVSDNLRRFLQEHPRLTQGTDGHSKGFTSVEMKMIVKVFQVLRLNMLVNRKEDFRLYPEITRFPHSCASNCHYSFKGRSLLCYTRCFIQTGEELTISCNALNDVDPIHDRRLKYREMKAFTCHCPRCDAIGDDTRQFDCFDSACQGVMMVCQPVQKRNIPGTDVEYAEPHLLPCTVCHRAAPANYQREMLALETVLLDLGPRFAQRFTDLVNDRRRTEMEPLYKELSNTAQPFPSRHAASLPLLRVKYLVLHYQYLDTGPRVASALQEAVLEYVEALENICTYPGEFLSSELTLVVTHCSKICFRPVFPPLMEKALCLKALRMHLLLYGRETRHFILDNVTVKCHERLPSSGYADICAFCEESPQRAALNLNRCVQCRLVVYCSAGCQKAHWKVHKKTCKPAVGWK